MPANDFLAYLTQRQRPNFNAGAAPALMAAPTAPYENPGALFAGAFQQAYQSGVDNRFRQDELDRQDAALAQQQQQIDSAREVLFDEVAAGNLDPRALQQFDVAPGEAKLALAQQALAGPEQLSPEKAAELELEYARLAQDQDQFGATQGLEQQRFGLEQQGLDQEAMLAMQENQLARDRLGLDTAIAGREDILGHAELALKKQQNEQEIAQIGRLKQSDLRAYQGDVQKVTALYDDAQKRVADSKALLDRKDPKSAFLALRSIMRLSSNEALNEADIANALSKGLIDNAFASYARSIFGQENLTPEQFDAFSNALDVYQKSEAERYDNQIADIANALPDNLPDDQRQDVLGRANRTEGYNLRQAAKSRIEAMSPEQRAARLQELRAKRGG